MSESISRSDVLRTGALAFTAALLPGVSEAGAAEAVPPGAVIGDSALLPTSDARAFLRLDTLKGESTDTAHRDWIDVISWTFDVNQPGIRMSVGSRMETAPRASFAPLRLFKRADTSSPLLLRACGRAQQFKTATLHAVHAPAS